MARYPFPYDMVLPVGRSLLAGERDLLADSRNLASRILPPPVVRGHERIPPDGPVLVAANHYQRRGLWIGWPGAVITVAVAERRSGRPPIHWLSTGGIRFLQSSNRGPEVPLSAWLLRRVAHAYGMTPLPLGSHQKRAASLRAWLGLMETGWAVGIFPEGLRGSSGSLCRAEPGFDRVLRLAGRFGATVIPVGIYEESDRLHVVFGHPVRPASSDDLMQAVADLLPVNMRGPFTSATVGR